MQTFPISSKTNRKFRKFQPKEFDIPKKLFTFQHLSTGLCLDINNLYSLIKVIVLIPVFVLYFTSNFEISMIGFFSIYQVDGPFANHRSSNG